MGLLDKFKEIITENDDDFDDYYDDDNRDYGLAAPERAERQERPRHEWRLSRSARNALAAEDGTIRWSISTPPPSCRWCW